MIDDFGEDGFDEPADAEPAEPLEAEAPSPLVGEAVRILGAVQDWARQTFPGPQQGHGGPECQWCPLCQFAAVLRGERPEVTERVAEAGTAMMSAVRAFVDAASSAGPQSGHSRPAPGPDGGRVQRIDLTDADPTEADLATDPGEHPE